MLCYDTEIIICKYFEWLEWIILIYIYLFAQVVQERADEEAQAAGDKKVNLKPMHHKPLGRSFHSSGGIGSEHEAETEEDSFQWTLRKQSALVLDKIAVDYSPDEVLSAALPSIQLRLQSEDVWIRESALLALGALANGCRGEMSGHMKGLTPFLLRLLSDDMPEVRSIAAWVLSRYCSWMFEGLDEEEMTAGGVAQCLEAVIQTLLATMLDSVPKVQSAACSAMCVVIDEGQEYITPYIPMILPVLQRAFMLYGVKNQLVLCDTIGTLADSVGSALASPEYSNLYLPILIKKFNETEDYNDYLFPIMECLCSIIAAVSTIS